MYNSYDFAVQRQHIKFIKPVQQVQFNPFNLTVQYYQRTSPLSVLGQTNWSNYKTAWKYHIKPLKQFSLKEKKKRNKKDILIKVQQ